MLSRITLCAAALAGLAQGCPMASPQGRRLMTKPPHKVHAHHDASTCPAPNPRDTEIPAECRCEALGVPELASSNCTSDMGTRTVTGIQDPEYDPTLVDWRSLSKSVEFIASKEPRVCNMAIRAHFHDALAYILSDGELYGSDGSVMMDAYEFTNPVDSADAFSFYTRTIVVQLSYYYGASMADILNVVAFTCVKALGAIVPIPEQCAADGVDLRVGKLDAPFQFTNEKGAERTNHLPGAFDLASFWLNFFFVDLNSRLPDGDKFRFELDDALAVMGSHGNIQDVGCMHYGSVQGTASPSGDQCSGPKRVFAWDNSYFKDGNSGMCETRAPSGAPKGQQNADAYDTFINTCRFENQQASQLRDQLVCDINTAQQELGIPPDSFPIYDTVPPHTSGQSPFWAHVDWSPNPDTRADCCGYVCPLCDASSDAFYCGGKQGTTYWPYTWNDCDLVYAANNPDTYCGSEATGGNFTRDCETSFVGPQSELASLLAGMKDVYQLFARSNEAWQQAYARGHCKMNNYGARYSNKATELLPLLNTCKGGYKNGACASDPSPAGVLQAPPSCGGRNCEYDLNEVATPKTCLECAFTAQNAPPGTPCAAAGGCAAPELVPAAPSNETTPVFGGLCAPKPAAAPGHAGKAHKKGKMGRKAHKKGKKGKTGLKAHKQDKKGKQGKKHG